MSYFNDCHGTRLSGVSAAVSEAIQHDLQTTMAPLAYRVAKTLLVDERVSAPVRADLSIKILDRAGHVIPSTRAQPPQKAMSEMSRDELVAFIERNQAAIDKTEAELAGQARDVSPQSLA